MFHDAAWSPHMAKCDAGSKEKVTGAGLQGESVDKRIDILTRSNAIIAG
jgi:hypothetical protein